MAEEPEVFVCCHDDFPRCLNSTGQYSVGVAKKQSECACEVAWKATAHLFPKVRIKEPPNGSQVSG